MHLAIAHRGPDDDGVWTDAEAGVAFAHRRLSIIDLSAAGRQPMQSASGRFVLIYNGEIYNHRDLREDLDRLAAAPEWRGHSDTEVILAGFERWGIRETVERLNGMFTFAVWDRRERVLTLGRDRLGEKPLYYGRSGGVFLFGSELKALAVHPAFSPEVDRDALTQFLRYNYVPAPRSIWRGISKLPPGHLLEVRDGGRSLEIPVPYWRLAEAAAAGAASPLSDAPERLDELEALLRDAVQRRMEAEVPLGAFLSGGVDSSLIVALMQAQSSRPVRTFTIGFDDPSFNEAEHARAVANHLGTDHVELYAKPEDALALISRLPTIWDEPFSDSSQIPTYLVSALSREHVTVALSGDGGDELFGGYNRYATAMRLWDFAERLPTGARKLLAKGLRTSASARAASLLAGALPARRRPLGLADRLPKVAQLLEESSRESLYRRLLSREPDPEAFVIGGREPALAPIGGGLELGDFREAMMFDDTCGYLPDDILAKVDRATMAVSLEARVPFLDHRVVEYAWRLPLSMKIQGGRGKVILRQLLDRHVPRALIERPKMGFAVPIERWLAGELRPWAEALLDERRLRGEGYLNAERVRALWTGFLSGRRNCHVQLWGILMFQAWLEQNRTADAIAA